MSAVKPCTQTCPEEIEDSVYRDHSDGTRLLHGMFGEEFAVF